MNFMHVHGYCREYVCCDCGNSHVHVYVYVHAYFLMRAHHVEVSMYYFYACAWLR